MESLRACIHHSPFKLKSRLGEVLFSRPKTEIPHVNHSDGSVNSRAQCFDTFSTIANSRQFSYWDEIVALVTSTFWMTHSSPPEERIVHINWNVRCKFPRRSSCIFSRRLIQPPPSSLSSSSCSAVNMSTYRCFSSVGRVTHLGHVTLGVNTG